MIAERETRLWCAIDARCMIDMDRYFFEELLHSLRICPVRNYETGVVT